MLLKKNRLPSFLIPQILKTGKRFYGHLFTLIIKGQHSSFNYPLIKLSEPKLNVIVPKKVCKKAVDRNRIKRRLSEAIRLSLKIIKPRVKGIFLAKKEIKSADFLLIKAEVEKFLRDAEKNNS